MTKQQLKTAIEAVAKEESRKELEVITEMQTGAAIINNEKVLDMLCELKWEYI